LINCAGLNALEIANSMFKGEKYKSLPVKGKYLISRNPMKDVKTLVYPIPINQAMIGIHSTITTDGYVKVGPSITPAFSSENYKGIENIYPS